MSEQNSGIFDLDGALDRLAARVCCEIKSKQRRKRATDEFRGHLEDAIEDIMRQGIPPEQAYAELEESFAGVFVPCFHRMNFVYGRFIPQGIAPERSRIS